MKSTATGVLCALAVFVAAGVDAQQSLAGDKRSISAEPRETKGVVIDNSSLVRGGRSSAVATAGDNRLLETVEECAAALRQLNEVLAETIASRAFFDPDWRQRFDDAASRMMLAHGDFGLVRVDPAYRPTYDAAGRTLDRAVDALEIVQSAIASNQAVITSARNELLESEQELITVRTEMRAAQRSHRARQDAPPIDPIAAYQTINDQCGRRFDSGSQQFGSCVREQQRAVDSLASRSAAAAGVSTERFNSIRNNCLFEWPEDFVERDRCEQLRMSAAAGR